MLQQKGFPISPDELVGKAKTFIATKYGADDVASLDVGFEFVGPFVGPLSRDAYVNALQGSLNPEDGFPDLKGRQYGFVVDPVEEGRVWWLTRPMGTFTGEFMGVQGSGQLLETPPQAMGVVFTGEGKARKFNMGTPVDRTAGNTGGMGGLFAFLWFVGKPLPVPECSPYKMSLRFRLLSKLGALASKLQPKKEE